MKLKPNQLSVLLNNLLEGMYVVDLDRKIVYWNKAAERITGRTEEVASETICCWNGLLKHVDEEGRRLCGTSSCPLTKTLATGEAHQMEAFILHEKGHRVPVFIRVIPLWDEDGKMIGAAQVFNDISHLHSAKAQVGHFKRLASMDELTDLPNRRTGENYLGSRLAQLGDFGPEFGILYMDIDKFKHINDEYGHDVGDQVLKMVACTIKANLRATDLVCRWGGEEFVAVVTSTDDSTLLGIANKIRSLVEQSELPHERGPISVTLSVGATLARPDDTIDSVVKRADELLYVSKRSGRNRVTMTGLSRAVIEDYLRCRATSPCMDDRPRSMSREAPSLHAEDAPLSKSAGNGG